MSMHLILGAPAWLFSQAGEAALKGKNRRDGDEIVVDEVVGSDVPRLLVAVKNYRSIIEKV